MSLQSNQLIDALSFGITKRFMRDGELLTYWIAPSTPKQLSQQIERVLLIVDALLDLDLERTSDRSLAQLEIEKRASDSRTTVDSVTGERVAVIGEAIPKASSWLVEWTSTSTNNDLETVVHELGHVFGLAHPNPEDPRDKRYSSADSVMSYNRNSAAPGRFFTPTDRDALTSLWGRENDAPTQRNNWVKPTFTLTQTSSQQDIQTVLNQPDATSFVQSAYQFVFGRPVDTGGLQYWQQQLSAGLPRNTLLAALQRSPEAILAGPSLAANLQQLLSQSEPVSLIQGAYQGIFGRSADSGGLQYWQQQLGHGLSNRSFLEGMLLSPEATQTLMA